MPVDPNRRAKATVDIIDAILDGRAPVLDAPLKNPNAVALGKLGGSKGGKARAAKLDPQKRSEIAKKAAMARWGRKDA